jgi:hypothetical protein
LRSTETKVSFSESRSVDEEIEFAAWHFFEIDADDLKGIDVGLLELIVSSDGLQLESEDSLLTFILNLESEDELVLVRYLRTEYLSTEGMILFLDRLGDSILDRLVWNSVCRRLVLRVRRTFRKGTEAKSLDGIISHLTKEYGGNVQEKRLVIITSKSEYHGRPDYALKHVADLTSDSFFYSCNQPDQWICWDFRKMRVRLTHYTIKTRWLKSWVVEGSLDGRSWTEIDRQTNNQDFERWWTTVSFAVSGPAEFQFIRLTQTDENHYPHHPDDQLVLGAVEFFGTLSE